MTHDTDKPPQGRDGKEERETARTSRNSAPEALARQLSKAMHQAATNMNDRQIAQSAGIQIQPPQGTLYLGKSYVLGVTGGVEFGLIYWETESKTPPPGKGKFGHTFIFSDDGNFPGLPQNLGAITALDPHGNGTITITATGRLRQDQSDQARHFAGQLQGRARRKDLLVSVDHHSLARCRNSRPLN
ncbi:hypothetical protein C5748_27115 [Phyllobacterium phragmitis]|uniref:Uncharacterized protein n=1 Tax=Phyllobacterium phragmitis TaxID=2670329 RepID=A0A2S9IIR0_9HYPH|nr:hypothetical protein C5748_27115 [Phyllobacterium phragmitis]